MNTLGTGGIVNVGLTCYANAAIQAFRHTKGIEELLKEENYNTHLKKDCKYNETTIQIADIIQRLSSITSNSSLRPNGFWLSFSNVVKDSCFEHLITREAHDAHEFLMFILDCLHESFSKEIIMNITACDIKTERQMFHKKSLETWKKYFEKQYSPLVNLYFGLFHIQIICSECKNISNCWETFNTLKGVISNSDKSSSLINCIMNDLKEEIIDEYSCDKCSPKRVKAIRKTHIWKLPTNLIIVLKRFTMDGSKIYTPVEHFEENINFDKLFTSNSPNNKYSKYTLRSIVDHLGSSNGGHYVAQAKNRNTNKWFHYDDQNVSSIDSYSIGQSSYIFFFESFV